MAMLVKRAFGFAQGYASGALLRNPVWTRWRVENSWRGRLKIPRGNSLLRIDIAVFKGSLFCFPHI